MAAAVRFAGERGLELAVRGGGHNVAGAATPTAAWWSTFAHARRMDASGRGRPRAGRRHLGRGRRSDRAARAGHDRGIVSETGVAGLALSGGVSHQRRRDGITIDNLVSAEVVLADGRCVRASADEHQALLGAARRRRQLRGRHLFGAAPARLGPEVFGMHVAYRIEDAAEVLEGLARCRGPTPRTSLSSAGFIWSLPVVEELPELAARSAHSAWQGMWAGDPAEGDPHDPATARAGHPAARHEPQTFAYVDFQKSSRPVLPRGISRDHLKALYLEGLSDAAWDTTVHVVEPLPSPNDRSLPEPPLRLDRPDRRRGYGVRRPQLRVDAGASTPPGA